MNLLSYFTRRTDGRCTIPPDVSALESEIERKLALRKATRSIACPHKRAWATRAINNTE